VVHQRIPRTKPTGNYFKARLKPAVPKTYDWKTISLDDLVISGANLDVAEYPSGDERVYEEFRQHDAKSI
jgi:hypothetical protein